VAQLHGMGVRTVMVTGDGPVTAQSWHRRRNTGRSADRAAAPRYPRRRIRRLRRVLPEDKYALVQAFQRGGHVVACAATAPMTRPRCGSADGHRRLHRDRCGESAAGIVLTEPGLGGIVAAVQKGARRSSEF